MTFKLFPAIWMIMLMLAGCTSKAEKQARDAFLYGYPLVMMEETRQSSAYPSNTLQHLRSFPDHSFRNVVRTANDLTRNEDGTIDIYVQHQPPSKDKLSHWLPAPEAAPFALTLRLYWPETEALSGKWNTPNILPNTQNKN